MIVKYLLLALFGIAMAHFEGVLVVYLRQVLGLNEGDPNTITLQSFPKRLLAIERTREAATIVMLVIVAWLTGDSWLEKGIMFLWTFAFWDLFYYLSLYLVIRWPKSLTDRDVLFLIPCAWVAPVWFPVTVSSATIVVILVFLL